MVQRLPWGICGKGMTGIHPINALFSFLADLYCQEGRSEANETALALREAAQNGPKEWLLQPNPKPGLAQAAFQHAPHENAQTVINALPFIRWLDVADSISNLKSERAEKCWSVNYWGQLAW